MSSHGAAPSALGYLYQIQLALLELIRRGKSEPSMAVSLEVFDDVAFEVDSNPVEMLQSKHSISGTKSLADTSTDFWKTLRAWMDAIEQGVADPETVVFTLVTTAAAAPDGAAAKLRAEGRRPSDARRILEEVARSSESSGNLLAYQQFLALGADKQLDLLRAVVVLDAAPQFDDLNEVLLEELGMVCERRLLAAFLDRLMEWWLRLGAQHIAQVAQGEATRIYWEQVEDQIDYLRDTFRRDNLPIDVFVDDVAIPDEDDLLFVRQLVLVAATQPTIQEALRNYARAFAQRSRWIRDQLVTAGELGRYESELRDEWQNQFSYLQGQNYTGEEEEQQAGMQLYHRLQDADIWIRARFQARFVTRGTYQMLADRQAVGWHPDFIKRLREVLPIKEP